MYVSHNNSSVELDVDASVYSEDNTRVNNICDWSLLNNGCSESVFLSHLCSCNDPEALWCFVHNSVNEKEIYCVNRSKDFGFVCDMYPPLPLFRPGIQLECVDLIQWAFQAHTIVADSLCPNYQGARVKVPTELKINNWRALCANFEDQLLLEYLEYGFPLCINK